MNFLKNEKGFTLMETIISIAALAVVSGLILQIFIVSNSVNIKANEIDNGNVIVFNAIELFKKQKSADNYIREYFFSGCAVMDDGTYTRVYKGYDKAFEPVPLKASDAENPPEPVVFVLRVDFAPGGYPNYYRVEAAVTSYKDGSAREIVSANASKYFSTVGDQIAYE